MADPASSAFGIGEVVATLGERVRILHGPGFDDHGDASGGGDLDCAVLGHDPMWPLRLHGGWRLRQCLDYDITGSYWVLERDGWPVAVDALDDRQGIGRYGFPTAPLFDAADADAAQRAAYLAVKRLRKRIAAPAEWERIGRQAASDPAVFAEGLGRVVGERLGAELARHALAGRPPPRELLEQARRRQRLRRVRTPRRLAAVAVAESRRVVRRVTQPTGMVLVLAGPDGTGKSSVAAALLPELQLLFRRTMRRHWRPGLLPAPGTMVGARPGEASKPHGQTPHGRLLSQVLLAYYWCDFLLGSWLRIWPERTRSGLVLMERGWFDLAVDPRRYRLQASPRLVRALGRLLPRPDLVLVLRAPARQLAARKQELDQPELERQLQAWREVLPSRIRHAAVDASVPLASVVGQARDATLELLGERSMRRLRPGWTTVPGSSRWWLPRGPARTAAQALRIYQPVSLKARAGWRVARAAARCGAFRLTVGGPAPPPAVLELVAPHCPPGGHVAVMRSNRPARFLVLLLDGQGRPSAVAKVALDRQGEEALGREAVALRDMGGRLAPPLSAPRLLASEPGLLLTGAVPWRIRRDPADLPPAVAAGLGALFRTGAVGDGPRIGPSHGDCAPWNLLETAGGWVLVDWEAAAEERPAFFDVFHHLVLASALLGRPSDEAIIEGVLGRGPIVEAVHAYAAPAGLDATDAPRYLLKFLRADPGFTDGEPARIRAVLDTRERLLARLEQAIGVEADEPVGERA